jgi:hypothetical protein
MDGRLIYNIPLIMDGRIIYDIPWNYGLRTTRDP